MTLNVKLFASKCLRDLLEEAENENIISNGVCLNYNVETRDFFSVVLRFHKPLVFCKSVQIQQVFISKFV